MKPDSFKPAHWLDWFTAEEEMIGFETPFSISAHTVATNTRFMVAIPGIHYPVYSGRKNLILESLSDIIYTNPANWQPVPTQPLIDALGGFGSIATTACEKCDDGGVSHYCSCELCEATTQDCNECGGTGSSFASPEPTPNLILGQPFDTRYILYILKHAPPSPSVEVSVALYKHGNILRIRTPDYLAALMAMSIEHKTGQIPEIILPKESDAR